MILLLAALLLEHLLGFHNGHQLIAIVLHLVKNPAPFLGAASVHEILCLCLKTGVPGIEMS